MKKIILDEEDVETIKFSETNHYAAIFAKDENGKLVGMVLKDDKGWILRLGYDRGAYGYFETLRECLEGGKEYDYTFFVK